MACAIRVIATSDIRERVIAIAHEAAQRILSVYATRFVVEQKDDASPVTAADLAAHACIVAGLQRLTPEIPVLSEESADQISVSTRRRWSRFWLVDPLDGTREFVKRNGEFTVNIALIEQGVATFGVIQQPVTATVWYGGRGLGAWERESAALDRPLHGRRPAVAPLRVAASRSHRDPRTQALLHAIAHADPVPCGSSLKFCRIATGQIDVYPRFGPTSEWDTAAGQAIVEAAGGCVIDPQGRALRYNQRDTLLNGDFLALGDPTLPWREWLGAQNP